MVVLNAPTFRQLYFLPGHNRKFQDSFILTRLRLNSGSFAHRWMKTVFHWTKTFIICHSHKILFSVDPLRMNYSLMLLKVALVSPNTSLKSESCGNYWNLELLWYTWSFRGISVCDCEVCFFFLVGHFLILRWALYPYPFLPNILQLCSFDFNPFIQVSGHQLLDRFTVCPWHGFMFLYYGCI